MFNIKNKRGLSQVVAVVIFILLSLSSVALVFGGVKGLLDNTEAELAPAFSCPSLQGNPSKITEAKYENGELQINVKRSFTPGINSFEFILETPSGSERFTCGDKPGSNAFQCGNCFIQEPSQEKTFYFNTENVRKITLYANRNCLMGNKDVSS